MTSSSTNSSFEGVELLIRGTVQGVGFRPFVFNLASRHQLTGTVANTSKGVVIQASGSDEGLRCFIKALETEAPPLAEILSIEQTTLIQPITATDFSIIFSTSSEGATATIPPDISICDDCFEDIKDPDNRRYRYPFTNCTNCGPRFTIVENIPYDRPKTSMKVFPMCKDCQSEYEEPSNRRFHAQPNACAVCGPSISWHDNSGNKVEVHNPISETITALKSEKIVALRGLGGFHLVANGYSEKAIDTLRKRKGRPAKPLAVMVQDLDSARKICNLTDEDERLLLSPQHPIVLVEKLQSVDLPHNLAPNVRDIGVMLPYTPLHHLLFLEPDCPEMLIMTSGNISGIPICTDNEDAIDKLGPLVDFFLLHNREIVTRVDDSVSKIVNLTPRIYRRSRGYVPSPIVLPWDLPEIIACGGGLKSTFCLARQKTVFPSQHIGDLANLESYDFFLESINHLKDVFEINPVVAACDLHPDYMSSRYAKELDLPLIQVQHHHAHAVSVMAEHGLENDVLAIILDGTGYGTDGTIWGGEVLQASLTQFTRLGHLSRFGLPGSDIAAYEPWRVALSLMHTSDSNPDRYKNLLSTIEAGKQQTILSMLQNGFNCPATSSCGRLFDGVASLLNIQHFNTYEGQAAVELESLAWKSATSNWTNDLILYMNEKKSPKLSYKNGKWEISTTEFVKVILDLIGKGTTVSAVALEFHFLVIKQFTHLVCQLAEDTGIKQIVLSGGCLQNSLLLQGFIHALTAKGLEPFTAAKVPSNDGGISLGQAVIGGLSYVYRTANEGN